MTIVLHSTTFVMPLWRVFPITLSSQTDMPSLTTVRLVKEYAFKFKKTIHTRSSSSSSPSFLDITYALQKYLQFIVSFTFPSQHQIAVFTSHNNSSLPCSLPLFLWHSILYLMHSFMSSLSFQSNSGDQLIHFLFLRLQSSMNVL